MNATLDTNIKNIEDAKASIKSAIEAKGVAVPQGALIDTYAARVNEIQAGGVSIDLSGTGWENADYFPIALDRLSLLNEDLDLTREKFSSYTPTTNFSQSYELVYGPLVDTSSRQAFGSFFEGCFCLEVAPPLDTHLAVTMANMFDMVRVRTGGLSPDLKYVPWMDTSNVENMSAMFRECGELEKVPFFDTSKVTNMSQMFSGCNNLKELPLFDTSNVDRMDFFLAETWIKNIPLFDTSKVYDFTEFIYKNRGITEFPKLDTHNGVYMLSMFLSCTALTTIPELDFSSAKDCGWMLDECKSITTLGGFTGCRASMDLGDCTKLTKQSIMNVLNKLGKADPKISKGTPVLTLANASKPLLNPQDTAIATSKGWTINYR